MSVCLINWTFESFSFLTTCNLRPAYHIYLITCRANTLYLRRQDCKSTELSHWALTQSSPCSLTHTPPASPHYITMTAEKQGHKNRWSKVVKSHLQPVASSEGFRFPAPCSTPAVDPQNFNTGIYKWPHKYHCYRITLHYSTGVMGMYEWNKVNVNWTGHTSW